MSYEEQKGFRYIASVLEKKIIKGFYAYGNPLPSIRTLAEDFNVSPQTISKATGLLQEEGLVHIKRGSGIRVCYVSQAAHGLDVGMLIDSERSLILKNIEEPRSYHSKDIYLAYMFHMNKNSQTAGFVIYSTEDSRIPEGIIGELKKYKAFIVQGTLPACYTKWLADNNIPTVFINRSLPSDIKGLWGEVLIDESKIIEAFNYLGSLRHKKILFCIPSYLGDHVVIDRRYSKSIKAALKAYGKEPFTLEQFCLTDDLQADIDKLEKAIKSGFTASFGFNDVASLQLYQLLKEVDVKIPEDFSVIGFDDIFAANLSTPPLTTIKVPREQLVAGSFRLLEELFALKNKGQESASLSEKIPCSFIIRKSTSVSMD